MKCSAQKMAVKLKQQDNLEMNTRKFNIKYNV